MNKEFDNLKNGDYIYNIATNFPKLVLTKPFVNSCGNKCIVVDGGPNRKDIEMSILTEELYNYFYIRG